VRELGHGGMATVYRALDTTLDREVAIKVLHPHLAHNDEARARFHREARAVAKLKHRNIIEVYDYSGPDSHQAYIAMELVQGLNLRDFVTEHPIRVPEVAVMILDQVAAAVAHAHEHSVIHRDIKPENVLMQSDGMLKLTDFGIAHVADAEHMTLTGTMIGSPAHMSPEQIEGRAVDARSDVFSLGTLLYFLATGKLPFDAPKPHAVLKQVAEARYEDPQRVIPAVGRYLSRIIGRCLRVEPAERYQTTGELVADLRSCLSEYGLQDTARELPRYFAAPEAYEEGLRPRVVEVLEKKAAAAMSAGRVAAAIETCNRILALDEGHARAMKLLRSATSTATRHRALRMGGMCAGAAAVLAVAAVVCSHLVMQGRTRAAGHFAGVAAAHAAAVRLAAFGAAVEGRRRETLASQTPKPSGTRRPPEAETMLLPRRAISLIASPPREPRDDLAPQRERVALDVTAYPPAAQIFIDGDSRGFGKAHASLPEGPHRIRLVHPTDKSCPPYEETITLDSANPPRGPLRLSLRCVHK
jgi:serine/threonine-protein kinase